MRRLIVDHSLVVLLAVAALAPACKSKDPEGRAPAPSQASSVAAPPAAPASAAPAPIASAAAAPTTACNVVGQAFDVAASVRGETGGTLVTLEDGRIAVGYAVGSAPKVAILDPAAAKATEVDLLTTAFDDGVKALPKGATLAVQRVTPLGASGMKMRAAVDVVVTMPDKTRRASCAGADVPALTALVEDGGAADLFDCRTMAFAGGPAVAGATFRSPQATTQDAGSRESAWVLRGAVADGGSSDATLAARAIGADKAGSSRYAFELPAFGEVPGAGAILASRYDGKIVVARRGADETATASSDATLTWLGAPVGAPAVAAHAQTRTVVIVAPVGGAVFGALFPIEGKPPELARIALPSDAAAEGERTSLSAAVLANGHVVVASVDGKATKRARLALVDPALASKGEPLTLGDDAAQVSAIRVHPLDGARAVAVYRVGAKLRAAVVDCAAHEP